MNKADAFREQLRLKERLRKLKALADNQPDTPEGRSARAKAEEIAKQLGIHPDTPHFGPSPKINVPDESYFGAIAATFRRQFPGRDEEDYTKYERKKRED